MSRDATRIVGEVLDASIKVQRVLGRGLYEHPYREALCHELRRRGLRVEREVPFAARYEDLVLPRAFRADILVEGSVMVELKAIEALAPIHFAQARTYLRFSGCQVVVLVNFHAPRIVDCFFPIHLRSLHSIPAPSPKPSPDGMPESFGKG